MLVQTDKDLLWLMGSRLGRNSRYKAELPVRDTTRIGNLKYAQGVVFHRQLNSAAPSSPICGKQIATTALIYFIFLALDFKPSCQKSTHTDQKWRFKQKHCYVHLFVVNKYSNLVMRLMSQIESYHCHTIHINHSQSSYII